jgi:hypothetical protein
MSLEEKRVGAKLRRHEVGVKELATVASLTGKESWLKMLIDINNGQGSLSELRLD